MTTDESPRFALAQEALKNNDPPIEVNQVWIACNGSDVIRRLRILAKHPDDDAGWIYQEIPVGRSIEQHIGICPEFNLRYVFELERKLL